MIATLLACYSLGPGDEVTAGSRQIEVSLVRTIGVDAVQPTDVDRIGEALVVVDGYNERLVVIESGRQRTLDGLGRVRKASPALAGGLWLTDGSSEVRRVDLDGELHQRVDAPFPVTAMVEATGGIWVGGKGSVANLDPATWETSWQLEVTHDQRPIGAITDVARRDDHSAWFSDAFAGLVHVGPDCDEERCVGRFGHWVGSLASPKGLSPGPQSTLLVVDSIQGAVQVFDDERRPLGVLAVGGSPLDLDYPVAIAVEGPKLWVLDAGPPRLMELSIPPGALEAARERASVRALRLPLGSTKEAADPETCRQCHDGLVLDGREVFDRRLHDHPTVVPPKMDIPEELELVDGKIVCGTCHTPHLNGEREEADLFTRLARQDDALCAACHGEDVHGQADLVEVMDGSGHLSGAALRAKMDEQELDEAASRCVDCHAVHGAPDQTLVRSDQDSDRCLACHEEQADGDDHPVGDDWGDHGIDCLDCHAMAGALGPGLLRPDLQSGAACGACHDEAHAARSGAHARVDGAMDPPCLGCHDLHGGASQAFLHTLHAAGPGDADGCRSCHEGHGEQGHRSDGLVLPDGSELQCDSCHDAHAPDAGGASGCGACHGEQQDAADRGGHGDGTTCLDCHSVHEAEPSFPPDIGLNPRSLACLSCHDGSRTGTSEVTAWDHPTPVFDLEGRRWTPLDGLPLFDLAGEEVDAGASGELTCASCHWTHGPDEGTGGDSLRRQGWEPVCASCHGDDALMLYRYFHQPDRWGGGS